MQNKEIMSLIYLNAQTVYINERILKRLRAGGFEEALLLMVIGAVVFLTFHISGIDGFALIDKLGELYAHTDRPWPGTSPTISTPSSPPYSSTSIAVIPNEAQEFNEMLLQFNEPKPPEYTMAREEALELIGKTYPGQMEVTDNERITEWQAAKHLYHAIGLGIDPEMYGMT